jgi:hypothetical protein
MGQTVVGLLIPDRRMFPVNAPAPTCRGYSFSTRHAHKMRSYAQGAYHRLP